MLRPQVKVSKQILPMNYVVQGLASVLSVLKYGFHVSTVINGKSPSHFCTDRIRFLCKSLFYLLY